MSVFQQIHNELLRTEVVHPMQVHTPAAFPDKRLLELVHCPDYVEAFRQGTLDASVQRRIGLPWSEVSRMLLALADPLELGFVPWCTCCEQKLHPF
eukprot:gene1517-2150_t